MRHTYKNFLLSTLAIVLISGGYAFHDQLTALIYQPQKQKRPSGIVDEKIVPQNTLSQIQQNLAQREYHISYDSLKHSLQSPNRKQGIRAYYKPGLLTIVNRKDSAGHNFRLDLINEGIYADGKKLFTPQQTAQVDRQENKLHIRHGGFTEEYINDSSGVRQNFIVDNAPEGTQILQVKLEVKGMQATGSGDEFTFRNGTELLHYQDLQCWDANQRPLLASMHYVKGKIQIDVNVEGVVYPVTIDPLIVNGNPVNANSLLEKDQALANFGSSVSSAGDVNGDGYSDVIIGAPLFDNNDSNEGVAFVYHGSATGLATTPACMLEANQPDAKFGASVSTAGDVNNDGFSDVIVGAPMFDKGESNEGAAFVYHGAPNTGINTNAVTILESNQPDANFGQSVALAGDVNNNGFSDVIVGAPTFDKGETNEGAAFIYHGSGLGVASAVGTTLESNQPESQFGASVKAAGDVNGDGYSDIIVGAFMYDKGQNNEGAAFVYHGSAGGVGAGAVTILESNQPTAYFGYSVSIAGDVNLDGFSDVIVGSFLYDNGQNNEGGAFVYYGSQLGIKSNLAKLLECNQAGAQYGVAVAAAGDVNGDGIADVIVGANYYDNVQGNEGGAFVYEGSTAGLNGTPVSIMESDQNTAGLGSAVASAGDVNGDGYSDVVTGAPLYDKGQADEGAVFVWMGGARGVFTNNTSELTGQQDQSEFGQSVANAGDVNGDGYSDIIVGAPLESPKGAAYIYHGGPQGVNLNSVTKIDNIAGSSSIAYSVAGAGDVNGDGFDDVIIGDMSYFVSFDAQKGLFEGAALVFYGSNQGIDKNNFTVIKNSTQPECSFGWVVAGAGDVNGDGYDDVLIGDPNYDKQFDEGAAFVYHGSSQGISTTPAIRLEGNQASEELGLSVAGAGDLNSDGFDDIIVGAPFYSNGHNAEGAALVFYGSGNGIMGPPKILESNLAGALMGTSVSGAGDLNGDGFSDVAIGSPQFVVNQSSKGAAFVYHGSSSGVNDASKITLDIGQVANFGNSVSKAGDFNGDGYGDLIVGAFEYSQAFSAAFLYFGSIDGIYVQTPIKLESSKANSRLGASVACAGDVNGDGYSDVLIGAPVFNTKGSAFLCRGNSGTGMRNNLRIYNSNLTTPINHNQFAQNNFGAGLFAKSFLGRNKGKLVWETKPLGQGFSKGGNNSITNSTQFTTAQNSYTNLWLNGVELKSVINKQGPSTKVRARVKYDPVLALTGQTYGPWRYLPAYLMGNSTAPVPEEAKNDLSETIKQKAAALEKELEATIVYPNPASDYLKIDVKNADQVVNMRILTPTGSLAYQTQRFKPSLDLSRFSEGTYFLIITKSDGSQVTRKILVKR